MNDEKVIGLYGGPLDGERRTVDSLPHVYVETFDGRSVYYESNGGSGHSLGLDPFIATYCYVESLSEHDLS